MSKQKPSGNANPDMTQKRKRTRRRRLLPLILIAISTGIILLCVFVLTPPENTHINPDEPEKENTTDDQPDLPPDTDQDSDTKKLELKEQFYTFLLAGTNDSYNTDTIMLCSVDVNTHKVNMISVPRDSMVDRNINCRKINNAYGRKGAEELCTEVTEVTGVPINYYCVINIDSFVEIVDLIGGVEYNVPIRMYHADADARYAINLQKGWQTLNGKEATQFCRFRSTSENDFGRMNRQKDFLLATLTQVREKFDLTKIKGFIDVFNESVKTNMSARDMVWFYLNVMDKLDISEDVTTDTLPYSHAGKYKGEDYVYLDAPGIVELVNKTVNPYTTDITEDMLNIVCLEDK